MTSGIGASLVTVAANTLIKSSDGNSNWTALNTGGISNDGVITTDGSGNIKQGNACSTYLITPYQVVNGPTYNSGTTYTVACTGVGGVPSGARAVLLEGFFYPSVAGMQVNFYPHGSTAAGYPQKVAPGIAYAYDFQLIAVLDATGKLDILPNGGNAITYVWMYGYLY